MCILFDFMHSQFVLGFICHFYNLGVLAYAMFCVLFRRFCHWLSSNLLTRGNSTFIQSESSVSYLAFSLQCSLSL